MKNLHLFNLFIAFFVANANFAQSEPQNSVEIPSLSSPEKILDYLENLVKKESQIKPEKVGYCAQVYDSIANTLDDKRYHAKAMRMRGLSHYVNKEYDTALIFFLDALRIMEKIGYEEDLFRLYSNIGSCAYNINDFENAEKYYHKGLKNAKKQNQKNWVAIINNNLSVHYMEMEKFELATNCMDSALLYFNKTFDTLNVVSVYINKGNLMNYQQKYDEAIFAYKMGNELLSENLYPLWYGSSSLGIGLSLIEQNKYAESLIYLEKSLELGKRINHNELITKTYALLAQCYSKTNQFEKAYNLSVESGKFKDSIYLDQQSENMADALAKFETEKKEAEIKFLNLENAKNKQQQNFFLYLAILGFIITSAVIYFLIKNRKKNSLLNKQKKLLEVSIDEKNLLLKETHHRVKNSFQIVSSLLYLQSESMENKEAQLAIKEAQNRVRSMILIHQKLYNKEQLIGINTQEYFTDLINDIFDSYSAQKESIDYKLDVIPLILGIESIIPLGLILNEMITNTFKHAFPKSNTERKSLYVKLIKKDKKLILSVSDNGIGDQNKEKDSSFGISLITALSKKLNADFKLLKNVPIGTIALLEAKRYNEL